MHFTMAADAHRGVKGFNAAGQTFQAFYDATRRLWLLGDEDLNVDSVMAERETWHEACAWVAEKLGHY